MPKIRVYYYDQSGKIVEVEHRPDEIYTQENEPPRQERGVATWITVDVDDFNKQPPEQVVVKNKKLEPRP